MFYLPWIFKFPLPELWRLVTPFWVTGGGLSILFDTYFCEPHSNPLQRYSSYSRTFKCGHTRAASRRSPAVSPNRETSSPILFSSASQSWYVSMISFPPLVYFYHVHYFLHHIPLLHICQHTSHICPPSHHLAEAVPGDEGDHPCISCRPVIRNQSLRACMRCRHGGSGI